MIRLTLEKRRQFPSATSIECRALALLSDQSLVNLALRTPSELEDTAEELSEFGIQA